MITCLLGISPFGISEELAGTSPFLCPLSGQVAGNNVDIYFPTVMIDATSHQKAEMPTVSVGRILFIYGKTLPEPAKWSPQHLTW